jgi:hypothetical protein
VTKRKPRPSTKDAIRAEWKPRDPRSLYTLRDELLASMGTDIWTIGVANALEKGQGTIQPHSNPTVGARMLAQDETDRLRAATICSVSAPMTKLAIRAGKLLPTWGLRREDLPRKADGKTPMLSGFAVFDAPFAEYTTNRNGRPMRVSIVAASWGPTRFGNEDTLWVTFYSAKLDVVDMAALAREHGVSERALRDADAEANKTLVWDNEILGVFGQTEIRIAGSMQTIDPSAMVANYAAEHSAPWLQTLRAAWMMMRPEAHTGQRRPLAEVVDVPTSSKATRRALREGTAMNTEPVRVLRLHHSRRSTGPQFRDGKKLDHQHEVEPYVRWQHYPSRGTIELIAIDKYTRGPKDAPFRAKPPTVLRLDRPPGGRPPREDEVEP